MRPLVTYLHEKLAEVYFRFKKIEEIIDIYEETCEKADERFQSAHAEAVSLTRKHDTEEKQPCLCRNEINWNNIPSEAVKQYWQRSVCFLSLNIAFTDMITLENLQAHPKSCH